MARPDIKRFTIEAPRDRQEAESRPVHHPAAARPRRADPPDDRRLRPGERARSRSSSRGSARRRSCSTCWTPATRSSTSSGRSGKPSDVEPYGTVVVIGGGVGAAIAYPTAKAMKEAGNHVISIVGARNRELVILEPEIGAISDELLITTDDGSYGRQGVRDRPAQGADRGGPEDRLRAGDRAAADDAGGRRDDPAARHQDRGQPQLADGRRHRHVRRLPRAHHAGGPVRLRRRAGVRRPPGRLRPPRSSATGSTSSTRPSRSSDSSSIPSTTWTGSASRAGWSRSTPRSVPARPKAHERHPSDPAAVEQGAGQDSPPAHARAGGRARGGRNFEEVNQGLTVLGATTEAMRCLQCTSPKCMAGCPVGVKVKDFVELIVAGEYLKAASKIREDNILPAITGRVCPQETQCEGCCILGNKFEPAGHRLPRAVRRRLRARARARSGCPTSPRPRARRWRSWAADRPA